MYFIYNIIVKIAWYILKIVALFNTKIKLFVNGRKDTFNILKDKISSEDAVIWIHVASLGEFEQGLPIIKKLRLLFPKDKILLSFFSPSGFEVKKKSNVADAIVYLPMDTRENAVNFIKMANPRLAIFIKYEIWPNYLKNLSERKIPTLLVSGIFSKNQVYFKCYGSFLRKALKAFTHFFLQDKNSQLLLKSIGFKNTTVSGDTRFDRVSEILTNNNNLEFMSAFSTEKKCFVAGSTWPKDESILLDSVNNNQINLKWVIAPHNIKEAHVSKLKSLIKKPSIRFSEISNKNLSEFDVIIIDTIGLLTKIYSYADIAYVGGGFETGLHNTLEPAVFGIPVIIGSNYSGFKEAEDLVALGGILVVNNKLSFESTLNKLLKNNDDIMEKIGSINSSYILNNKGASTRISEYICTLLKL